MYPTLTVQLVSTTRRLPQLSVQLASTTCRLPQLNRQSGINDVSFAPLERSTDTNDVSFALTFASFQPLFRTLQSNSAQQTGANAGLAPCSRRKVAGAYARTHRFVPQRYALT